MDPSSANLTGQPNVAPGASAAELQLQPTQAKPNEQLSIPTMSPADQRLCNIGGRVIAWFVFILGVVSALGSAWIVYLVARWLWSGAMAQQLSN